MWEATAGGAQATSYVTDAEAAGYFADRLTPGGAKWQAFSLELRRKALMQATRDLDRLRFKGRRATSTQALEFPRTGQREAHPQIPQAVRDATCEQAYFLLSNLDQGGRTRAQQLRAQGTRAFTVGDHSQEFEPGGGRATEAHLCPDAAAILRTWISFTGRVLSRGPRCNPGDPWGRW